MHWYAAHLTGLALEQQCTAVVCTLWRVHLRDGAAENCSSLKDLKDTAGKRKYFAKCQRHPSHCPSSLLTGVMETTKPKKVSKKKKRTKKKQLDEDEERLKLEKEEEDKEKMLLVNSIMTKCNLSEEKVTIFNTRVFAAFGRWTLVHVRAR